MTDYETLIKEMKHIKALLALSFVKDYETSTAKILFLCRFGFDRHEIADLIGTTPGSVAVAISQAKGKMKPRRKKAKQED